MYKSSHYVYLSNLTIRSVKAYGTFHPYLQRLLVTVIRDTIYINKHRLSLLSALPALSRMHNTMSDSENHESSLHSRFQELPKPRKTKGVFTIQIYNLKAISMKLCMELWVKTLNSITENLPNLPKNIIFTLFLCLSVLH